MIPKLAVPEVKLKLHETELTLRADFNALSEMERQFGMSFLDGFGSGVDMTKMKPMITMLHAMCKTCHPNMTRREVAKLVDFKTLQTTASAMKDVMAKHITGEGKKDDPPPGPTLEVVPQAVGQASA